MQQIKIFKCMEIELDALELQINHWLAQSKAKVLAINSTIAPQSEGGGRGGSLAATGRCSDVLITILYET
jgi:hypothetical protein